MKSSTKRILSIGISGVLFILTLVVYANLIRPAVKEVGEKRSVLYSKATALQNQEAAVGKVQELVSQMKGVSRFERSVSLIMPQEPGVTEALGQLRAITESSQVALSSFSISASPFQSSDAPLVRRLGTLLLGLSVTGSYENIKGFLQALETNVRVFNVKSARIVPARADSPNAPSSQFTAQMTVEVYYQE
ncbi:MAG: hypothetical protein Q8P01_00345 [bacterium]|nr:hypothetical protein [bacterium]